MFHRGRGNAIFTVAAAAALVLCAVALFNGETAEAASFIVGNAKGWAFDVNDWPNGKSFKAEDTLVFNYNPKLHNVVVVKESSDFINCKVPAGATVFTSGKDHVALVRGHNLFICGRPGHCEFGFMNINVTAA
ncbi:basic blue protein-like [Rhododendron vialii]|uniref:basic blue protein-like n=1 Tax=Rhododendron vialii TaxID=182163 RepID=UPI00265F51D9|nr:basic blue protein-like [Rhododendron vialii]XP_058191824.1 basic blue protein-like [Rhododendron vialii]